MRIGLTRCLFVLVVVLVLPAVAAAQLPIDVRSVYTTDKNFNPKTIFAPADTINYHVDVENTTGSTFPVDIRFQVFTAFNLDPTFYGYDQTHHVDQMPVGLSRFYSPTTLPSDARIHLGYILRVTVTESPCPGVDCDEDLGENRFSIQTTEAPKGGEATNLVVLVHGCCTDANDVEVVWKDLAKTIEGEIARSQTPETWEVVVWDWHEYTPKDNYFVCPACFLQDADAAYQAAKQQGTALANAIAIHSYKHVHFIGHSAGSNLIHDAATAYISDYFIRQENPFIHLTFLDAFTPNEWDSSGQGSYGSLPVDYPNHYSEHYVDRGLALTDACLENAFNFDITNWTPSKDDRPFEFGHQWPHRWYKKSVAPTFISGYKYGYPLSLEGSGKNIDELVNELAQYPAGQQCSLVDIGTSCIPASCW